MTSLHTTLAYLDAGSGSMILQLLVGGFAAAGVAMKMYWKRIKGIFGRGDDDDSSTVTTTAADAPAERDAPQS
ncbi:MAG: hypothetical protein NWQ82_05390 [Solirubrobacteraceae bacterium]|jgi:hypothetical protein|nr:hypothetical protein [Solirubrobacteraceae bacterium]MDP4672685.1 hypothetical protein [Solirubrobacteraceae bacterium]MDP4921381.1 hypothetical protein [Solirubrobacteraceae bacterium]